MLSSNDIADIFASPEAFKKSLKNYLQARVKSTPVLCFWPVIASTEFTKSMKSFISTSHRSTAEYKWHHTTLF